MSSQDGVWLIVMAAMVIAVVHQVIQDWDRPSNRKKKKKAKKKGSSCYYAPGTLKSRHYLKRSRRPSRVCHKKAICIVAALARQPLHLPQLQIGMDGFPQLREGWSKTKKAIETSRMPFGMSSCPLSFRTVDWCFQSTDRAVASIRYDSDSFQIAIDNCATSCFTNSMDDFVGTPTKTETRVMGIGQATATYVGTVRWLIVDDAGRRHELLIPGTRFQDSLPFRLLCPQHVAQVYQDPLTTCLTLMDKVVFVWGGGRWTRTLPLHKTSNVGLMWSAPGNGKFKAFAAQVSEPHFIPDDDEDEMNEKQASRSEEPEMVRQVQADDLPDLDDATPMSEPQREQPVLIEFSDEVEREPLQEPPDVNSKQAALRKCHNRLNHMPFARIQAMARQGLLPSYLAKVEPPMCASCAYGKATRRPWRGKGQQGKASELVPITSSGACVSVDQLESPTPGFIGQIKGILTTKRYRAATIFVDHYSQLTFAYMQFSTGADETVKAKRAFEAYASLHGVTVRHYHADNGRFAENLWLDAIQSHRPQQTISFCGVGAHHQNGVAEKKIRDLQENARTMMLHASLRWPEAHSVSLWPYALRMAVDVMNATPRNDKIAFSPIERFSGIKIRPQLKNFHCFGCPIYVLSAPLQTQQAQSKWMSRARLGINLGMSPRHSKSVALVLNPRTGLVSPQFHVKFDDDFDTVGALSDVTHGQWKRMAGFEAQLVKSRAHTSQNVSTMAQQQQDSQGNNLLEGASALDVDTHSYGLPPDGGNYPEDPTMDQEFATAGPEFSNDNMEFGSQIEPAPASTGMREPDQGLRRSSRQRRPTWRAMEGAGQEDIALPAAYEVLGTYLEPEIADEMNDPIAFLAKSDPDILYYHQAMKAEDAKEFRLAMQGEVDAHCDNAHWALCKREQVPEGTKVLDSVWAMRRKRRIKSKQVYKWKARLNLHGGQQEFGVNYWETFAPVVTWTSIRLVLILSIIHQWHTRQIDFVMAYPQAPIETPLWMEVPLGVALHGLFRKATDYVLELKKNLYGQKQAGRIWYKHLTAGLIQLGFTPSVIDKCVFYRGTTLFLVYVDDGIIAGSSQEAIDQVIADLQTIFKVSDEGDLTDYLGVNIERRDDGTIKLSQPHLIDQIIDDVNFQNDTKYKATPAASTKILNKDKSGEPHNASWHFRSIIGKLNFLEKSTRGELGYLVHQCARFCEEPKTSHTDAVHHIVRFLAGT